MRITEPNYYRYYKTLGLFTKLATSYILTSVRILIIREKKYSFVPPDISRENKL
jgi:hypothetical protein